MTTGRINQVTKIVTSCTTLSEESECNLTHGLTEVRTVVDEVLKSFELAIHHHRRRLLQNGCEMTNNLFYDSSVHFLVR
jgi:hypothetical protein